MPRTRSRRSATGKSSSDALVARLERLFAVIVAQVRDDPGFATRMEAALPARPPAARKPRPAPAPPPPPKHGAAVLDPFTVYEQGWEVMLNQRLDRLAAGPLGDIIHQYQLDPQHRMRDEKNPARVREWIVKAVLKKAEKV